MFPASLFPPTYFSPWYWPEAGAGSPPVVIGGTTVNDATAYVIPVSDLTEYT